MNQQVIRLASALISTNYSICQYLKNLEQSKGEKVIKIIIVKSEKWRLFIKTTLFPIFLVFFYLFYLLNLSSKLKYPYYTYSL